MAAFGIDFGTTTSGAVRLLAGRPQSFGDGEGGTLPSIVAVDIATGEPTGGRAVWNERFELEKQGNYHIIPSVKPYLGQDRRWSANGTLWTPTTAAAFVLKQLSEVARKRLRDGITKATMSIPVGMSAAARRDLRKAASLAGIDVESFVAESTSAVFRTSTRSGTFTAWRCSTGAAGLWILAFSNFVRVAYSRSDWPGHQLLVTPSITR